VEGTPLLLVLYDAVDGGPRCGTCTGLVGGAGTCAPIIGGEVP
jgi:hypothetical protein